MNRNNEFKNGVLNKDDSTKKEIITESLKPLIDWQNQERISQNTEIILKQKDAVYEQIDKKKSRILKRFSKYAVHDATFFTKFCFALTYFFENCSNYCSYNKCNLFILSKRLLFVKYVNCIIWFYLYVFFYTFHLLLCETNRRI